jgi:hypothetical protein
MGLWLAVIWLLSLVSLTLASLFVLFLGGCATNPNFNTYVAPCCKPNPNINTYVTQCYAPDPYGRSYLGFDQRYEQQRIDNYVGTHAREVYEYRRRNGWN